MAINNKTLETEKITSFHVILVKRDGVKKYISKSFKTSCFPCTVLIDQAKRFKSFEEAQKFITDSLLPRNDIEVIKTIEVSNTLKLCI